MNKYIFILLVFVVLSAGIALTFVARINQTTSDAALATGSRAIVLPELFNICEVFLVTECENTATQENVSLSYAVMTTILRDYPRSPLTTHYDVLSPSRSETNLLPIKDTASHVLVAIGRETGVSFRVMLALMSAIGSDPIRKSDADMQHPFGDFSISDGFALQTRDIALELMSSNEQTTDQLIVGGRTYVIAPTASIGSRAVYHFLAAHMTNPELFERVTLEQYKSRPDNLHFIWRSLILPR